MKVVVMSKQDNIKTCLHGVI